VKLAGRIFLAYLLISIACFSYPVSHFIKDLRVFILEGMEDPLADQAIILAEFIGKQMEQGRFDPEALYKTFDDVTSRLLRAKIYNFHKTRVDSRVYITDRSGRLIFDSADRKNIGADYSRWRDVSRTLKGEYGTRTTRANPNDPNSSVLYVAAPVMVRGKIAGALTVAKPTNNVNAFLAQEKPRVLHQWYFAAALAIALSFLVSLWLTQPIKRLTRYANNVREGKRGPLPPLGHSEVRDLGMALENMREALEGKRYVEQYIHTLTHEIKSPLSAIRGAAELMDEQMPTEKRARFLSNIRTEAARIQDLVDRMLELSALEAKKTLRTVETVSVSALVKTVLESKEPMFSRKGIVVAFEATDELQVQGDPFLLHQALSNIIQNAVDFSPADGRMVIAARIDEGRLLLTVDDEGPGIPELCADRVFDRFFSLHRPDTGKKSTGLGLNFVREVATLHNGDIRLENLPKKGLRATLSLPV
jgi:two-component system sensor histidine kinase CreC